MGVTDKVRIIMLGAGVSGRQLAEPLNCPAQTATNKLTRGLVKIDDIIRIVDYCGGSVQLVAKDGTVILLTLDDLGTTTK